jgi:hypothetical protein
MTLNERAREAQEKDVRDMQAVYEAVASGASPDAAAAAVIGGEFRLSDTTAAALIENKRG